VRGRAGLPIKQQPHIQLAVATRRWEVHDKCMAVKTITIDMEAYGLLSRHKGPGQSFSQVIKAYFGPQPTAARFLVHARSIRLSEDSLDEMERQVGRRHAEPARAVRR
jgi:predicted CopG family antitoxin